jgi:hypothetical protein
MVGLSARPFASRRSMTVPSREELLDLERAGWRALSSRDGEAASFYGRILDEHCLMLLPGGIVIESRDEAVSSMQGQSWESFELDQARILELADDVVVLAYRASARRGASEYRAWVNSTYVRRGREWRLALHQQTPDHDRSDAGHGPSNGG